MNLRRKTNSFFNSTTYRIGNILVDPGDSWDFAKVDTVLLTHAHFDHIYGLNEVLYWNPNVSIYTNESGFKMLIDARKNLSFYHETPFIFRAIENIKLINNRQKIEIEQSIFAEAIYTPGHNPSCITWILANYIFTGDAYIPGLKTITNLPEGNKKLAEESLELIRELAKDKIICPGHIITVL